VESIYLDYNSTTPVDPDVLQAMLPYFTEKFGNASSLHRWGWTAAAAVDNAREEVAQLIGAEPGEIVFTSGATEAINMAMHGVLQAYATKGKHMVICRTEHKAVIDTALALEKYRGAEISWLPVNREGLTDPEELRKLLRKDTVLVAVMLANNETGVMQDIERIGTVCREHGCLLLCDTTQAAGKIRLAVNEQNIDIAVLSAHKFYGPKGIGALYIRRKNPRVSMAPLLTGGGHEKGLRSGTLAVPLIVGMGAACRKACSELWDYGSHTSRLRTWLEQQLTVERQHGFINGSTRSRLPNTANLCFPGIQATRLISMLPEIGISTGSACSGALQEPSHVLESMGLSKAEIAASVRISIGKLTTKEETDVAILRIGQALDTLLSRA
jgi:cysteine desulfurase